MKIASPHLSQQAASSQQAFTLSQPLNMIVMNIMVLITMNIVVLIMMAKKVNHCHNESFRGWISLKPQFLAEFLKIQLCDKKKLKI